MQKFYLVGALAGSLIVILAGCSATEPTPSTAASAAATPKPTATLAPLSSLIEQWDAAVEGGTAEEMTLLSSQIPTAVTEQCYPTMSEGDSQVLYNAAVSAREKLPAGEPTKFDVFRAWGGYVKLADSICE